MRDSGREMGRDGKKLGKSWGKIKEYLCGYMEVCRDLWRSVEVCGRFVGVFEGLWRYLEICGSLWMSVKVCD